MKECEICGITEDVTRIIVSKKFGQTLCRRHLLQMTRHGKVLGRTIYEPNEITLHDDYALVALYDKQGSHVSNCRISLGSVSECSKYKWYVRPNGYVYGTVDGKKMQIHRFVMGGVVGEGLEIDHIDGDPLNNTLSNLRIVTHQDNMRNIHKDKTVGVNYNKHNGQYKWIPRIMVDGKGVWLGAYETKDEAVAVRKAAEVTYFE